MPTLLRTFFFFMGLAWLTAASAQTPVLSDNADSIAVVVGNKEYRRTSTVDFAHNDAEAIKAYLTGTLGFREQNVFLVKDATLGELTQMFGSEVNPQGSQLWRSVVPGRSNVFVYYSGHGVPDLATRQPFLLPHDGNPNVVESGYALQTLYRNLELVRHKIGAQRQLIVMIDACFTGETGRKGESLLAVSAPGFTPAKPRIGGGIIKLVATSGTTPANWDANQKLGLFTSRFLMGAAGLARPAGAPETGPLAWSDLQRYLKESVEAAARRDSGREQAPEIDLASIALPVAQPVPAVARAVAVARDEANWQLAKAAGERSALEGYVARCGETCGYREAAMALLLDKRRSGEAASDEQNWVRLGGAGRYEDYLKSCGAICAYRALAESYLSRPSVKSDRPARDPATRVGGPFSLTTSDSKKLTDRDLKGSPFLVFFGFSQCPDICPTTLMQISHLLYSTEAKGSKIKALFITVDPENDKPNVMKPFLEGFNPNIVGLTGNRTAIEATIKSYRAYARKIYLKTGGYTWDHTTTVYLMDKEGDFVRALDLEQDAAVLIQKILALI